MKKLPVVLDLETKEKFSDVAYDKKRLGVSIVGLYDYNARKPNVFLEKELGGLFKILENCSYLIGFNIKSFDIPVLQTYYPGDFSRFLIFDILEDIKEKLGKRLSLNYILQATLGKRKSGHGLQAIDYYKEGRIENLKKYCLDDVMLTKELFEYGVNQGQIFYLNQVGKSPIKVDWKKYMTAAQDHDTHLTLPF